MDKQKDGKTAKNDLGSCQQAAEEEEEDDDAENCEYYNDNDYMDMDDMTRREDEEDTDVDDGNDADPTVTSIEDAPKVPHLKPFGCSVSASSPQAPKSKGFHAIAATAVCYC